MSHLPNFMQFSQGHMWRCPPVPDLIQIGQEIFWRQFYAI